MQSVDLTTLRLDDATDLIDPELMLQRFLITTVSFNFDVNNFTACSAFIEVSSVNDVNVTANECCFDRFMILKICNQISNIKLLIEESR